MNQMKANQQQQQQRNNNNNSNLSQTPAEMQALQSKLAAIYSTDPSNDTTALPVPSNGQISMTLKQQQQGHNTSIPKVEIPPGNNPRRMPPPSLLKRDDSLKMEGVFDSPAGATSKKKVNEAHGSSAHLSAMSLSMGDLNDESNLSQVFDSSLKISVTKSPMKSTSTIGSSSVMRSPKSFRPSYKQPKGSAATLNESSKAGGDKSGRSWENPHFDMSVATLGAASEMGGTSEVGDMSYATFNMPEHDSFSQVFEETEK
jgi:hypothetical protein